MDEEQIPYDDPDVRRAYRRGWEARLQGRTRPEPRRVRNGKSAKAWLEGYIAAEDTGDCNEDSGSDDVEGGGDAAEDCAVEDGGVEDGTTYAKDVGDTDEKKDPENPGPDVTKNSGSDVTENPGPDVLDPPGPNPYGEEDARRREAYAEGYRAGRRGEALTRPASDADASDADASDADASDADASDAHSSDAQEDVQVMRARVEGYQAALEQREKD